MRMRKWRDSEKEFVRANMDLMSDLDIAVALSRLLGEPISQDAVEEVRARNGWLKGVHTKDVKALKRERKVREWEMSGGAEAILSPEVDASSENSQETI